MSEQPVDTNAAPYKESDDFVPDPTAAFGTLDTSGTSGGANERIEAITPVFDAAKAQDLQYAADALDPDNKENTDTASVVLPDDHITNDEAKENVADAAEAAAGVPVQDPSLTQAEADNQAKEDGTLTPEDVAAQQAQASPAGGTADTSDATQGSAADAGAGADTGAAGDPATGDQTGTTDTTATADTSTTPPTKTSAKRK